MIRNVCQALALKNRILFVFAMCLDFQIPLKHQIQVVEFSMQIL